MAKRISHHQTAGKGHGRNEWTSALELETPIRCPVQMERHSVHQNIAVVAPGRGWRAKNLYWHQISVGVRLTTCASAAGDRAGPRTNLRSTARSGRAVTGRRPAPTPARRLHARVRRRRGESPTELFLKLDFVLSVPGVRVKPARWVIAALHAKPKRRPALS